MTRKILKIIFSICFLVFAIYGLQRFCHYQTKGFSVSKLRTSFPINQIISLPNQDASSTLVATILQQPLSYIGRGGQCYAFTTQDEKYVVKILKYNNNYPKIWFRICPFPFGWEKKRQQKILNKRKKLRGEYQSYQIALQELKEKTGIIYFHLNRESLPHHLMLHIKDPIGIQHVLPADQYQFYIQKRGHPLYPGIQNMVLSSRLQDVHRILDQIVHYLFYRAGKHIVDGDDGIWRNFALGADGPFQIDIGQLSHQPSLTSLEEQRKNIVFFSKDFLRWLEQLDPSLATYFLQSISNYQP